MLASSPLVFAQQKMIVFLGDKSDQNPSVELSSRSLQRRSLKGISMNAYDRIVSPAQLAALSEDGRILNVSRWLNAVSYETELSVEVLMTKHPFIERIQAIAPVKPSGIDKFGGSEKTIEYGFGYEQVHQINLDCLHEQGYTGDGIFLGIIDAGFNNIDNNIYFDSVYLENRLLDSHNFVAGFGPVYNSSDHGTMVASCIVGEKANPDGFVGTAADVDLAFYLAEDVNSETMIEEFNVVAALERCDSAGVDVVNISLGYFDFDDTLTNHVYADLDGNTTVAAMGVNVAASKGIAVVVAAGNSGPSNISTPCDADSGLCVGAVDYFNNYAYFSSVGPNADGQVKPDVAARGQNAVIVTPAGDVTFGNGTSFATPIMAGATACLIQANPTKSVEEIFNALRMSASQYSTPDGFLGYGIPDLCVANDLLQAVGLEEQQAALLKVYPNPANGNVVIEVAGSEVIEISAFDLKGKLVYEGTQAGSSVINTNTWTEGVYTLRIIQHGAPEYHRLVIQH